ncbi:hypothetical protein [Fimbriiglobus ruber]|uniref:Uncharacterized protein n=1 Tax=Fimbriiglobus ruber TaxID=1908690 RepID=A0A225DMN7_9BACT|nr:hypothetical protein [Fimbriiglobus ruber]OWK37685.1 hypothetical protein FRUB_06805 [Fimbriiglobus ruber]
MRQWPQGLWVVTPDGKTLGFHYHKPVPGDNYRQNQQRWVDDTVKMLEAAAKAAGPLPPRTARASNPFPDRGVGPTKDGGVRLAVSVIGLQNGRQDGPPAVDSILLSKEEWTAFAPPEGKTAWALPEAVAKRFAPALAPVTDSIFVPRPTDVNYAIIKAASGLTADGVGVVRYAGAWSSLHNRDGDPNLPIRCDMTGEGFATYDAKTKQIRSFLWVLKGTYRNGANGTPIPTAAVVEWEEKE